MHWRFYGDGWTELPGTAIYNARFNIGLTETEVSDLAAFLRVQ